MELKELYERYGTYDYIGENITQIEHAMQCANLALLDSAPNEVVTAAFLHDVGHLIGIKRDAEKIPDNLGICGHENLGADYLKSLGFSTTVCDLVRNHVKTKRYLVGRNPEYLNNLSEASKATLYYQGGPLASSECDEYEKDPLFNWHLKLRQWDDLGKVDNIKIGSEKIWDIINHMVIEK